MSWGAMFARQTGIASPASSRPQRASASMQRFVWGGFLAHDVFIRLYQKSGLVRSMGHKHRLSNFRLTVFIMILIISRGVKNCPPSFFFSPSIGKRPSNACEMGNICCPLIIASVRVWTLSRALSRLVSLESIVFLCYERFRR